MNRFVTTLLVLVFAANSIMAADEFIDDDGNPISPFMDSLNLDQDLYKAWRKSQNNPNPDLAMLNNAVASDRLRVSPLLLTRIHEYVQGYIQASNSAPATLDAMPQEERTCPITLKPMLYFAPDATSKDAGLIVATTPSAIELQTHDKVVHMFVVLFADGNIRELELKDFQSAVLRNNEIRTKAGLPLITDAVMSALLPEPKVKAGQ